MDYVYGKFGFEYTFELSTRPENKMGTEEQWDYAEEALANALKLNNKKYIINPGDGAFYGPKIDVKIMIILDFILDLSIKKMGCLSKKILCGWSLA